MIDFWKGFMMDYQNIFNLESLSFLNIQPKFQKSKKIMRKKVVVKNKKNKIKAKLYNRKKIIQPNRSQKKIKPNVSQKKIKPKVSHKKNKINKKRIKRKFSWRYKMNKIKSLAWCSKNRRVCNIWKKQLRRRGFRLSARKRGIRKPRRKMRKRRFKRRKCRCGPRCRCQGKLRGGRCRCRRIKWWKRRGRGRGKGRWKSRGRGRRRYKRRKRKRCRRNHGCYCIPKYNLDNLHNEIESDTFDFVNKYVKDADKIHRHF